MTPAPATTARLPAPSVPAARLGGDRIARAAARLAPLGSTLTAGGLFALACPPHDWSAAAWLVPGLLLVGSRRARPAAAFACGVLYAVVIGSLITAWAPAAATAYFELQPLVGRAFIFGIHVVNPGIACGLMLWAYARLAGRLTAAQRPVAGALLWVACEWLRTWSLGWELLAHSQHRHLGLIQIADLGGAYLLSFVMAYCSIAVAELATTRAAAPAAWRRLAATLALPATLLAATVAYGAMTVPAYQVAATQAGDAARTVAIVQGNVPNAFRWKRAFFASVLGTYAELTARLAPRAPDLIVWPENAVSFYVNRESLLLAQLGTIAAQAREGLLLGAPRRGDGPLAYNSAYLLTRDGTVAGVYDKRRLLPFGEYNPFAPAPAAAADDIVYVPGESAAPLSGGGLRLGTLICFEVLYPGLVRDLVRAGAEVLVNLSNDSWMDAGDGAAPRQHLSMAVFRAVETRRFLVRAASGGHSAIVDPAGAITAVLSDASAGALVGVVRPRSGETPYVRWGDTWIVVALVALGADALLARRRGAA